MKLFFLNLTNKKTLYFLLVVLCLLVSLRYRVRNYWDFPPVHDTFDEFAAGWLGLSLLKSGVPTSWSFIPDYARGNPKDAKFDLIDTNISVNNKAPTIFNYRSFPKPILLTKEMELNGYRSHFNFVAPYLEQPPLGGIIISLPLFLSGQTNFSQTSLQFLRSPFVYYGVLSTFLVILIARNLYGRTIAVISGFIYATVPTIVVGSRMALPENLLTLLILLELHFILRKRVFLAFAISAVAPLIKPFGLALPLLGVGYYIFIQKDKNIALRFILIGAASFFCYILYGLVTDKDTFLSVLAYQSSRFFAGPLVFVNKIMIPRITKIFFDGWIFFGWIAFFSLCFKTKSKKYFPIILPVVAYVIVTSVFGGEDYGWYRFPLYPFLTISTGIIISKIFKANSFFFSLIYLFIVGAFCLQWGIGIDNWNMGINFFRYLLIGSLVMLMFYTWRAKRMLAKAFMIFVFVASIYLNTRIINNLGDIWPKLGDNSSLIQNRN